MNIPITFNSDEKGYFDRECPNENCLYTFKIHMDDWKEKVSDEVVYCPLCGHTAESDKWWTQKQLDDMRNMAANWAKSYLHDELSKSFKKLERSTQNNKFVKITYNPGKRVTFFNNPLGQLEEWEQEIQCSKCQTRYSVIGTAYFCPCCGNNVIESMFEYSLDNIAKMIGSLNDMETLFEKSYGKDKANSMCRALLESSLGDIVSAFQKFAEVRFSALSSKKVRTNDFQIIDKGSKLFFEATGKGYDTLLRTNEIDELKLAFQKRHIFEHNGGIVDSSYIDKTGDKVYQVGQRIVLHKYEVLRIIELVKSLSSGMKLLEVDE